MGEELPRATGAISANQDRCAVPMLVGKLGERGVEDSDMISGGVATRVPLPQLRSQELTGVVAEREQRVIPERLLVLCTKC
jgi:hypothetical protein